jgi:hypothetical protein
VAASYYMAPLAMIAGAALGAAATQGLHAQAKPIAYVIAEIEVTKSPHANPSPWRNSLISGNLQGIFRSLQGRDCESAYSGFGRGCYSNMEQFDGGDSVVRQQFWPTMRLM